MKSIVSFCLFAFIALAATQAAAAWEEASLPTHPDEQLVPANLELSFSGPVDLAGSKAILMDADGKTIPTDRPILDKAGGSVIKIPLGPSLAPGLYTLDWHVRSMDGQSAEGSYQFRVDP